MKENLFLKKFVPKDQAGVELDADLEAVARRIAALIPHAILYEMFSSSPSETGGRSRFPYYRVESDLIIIRNRIDIFEPRGAENNEDFKRIYEIAANLAFKAILWIEIGFEGLDNLAESHASKIC